MIEMLKALCELNGISGDEKNVRDFIISKIDGKADVRVDNLGNVIAFKKGNKTPKNKIMISAHMDEVGMIVNYIHSDGTLRVSPVGGVDPRVVFGRHVSVGEKLIPGVIGGKAVHVLTEDERKETVPFDKLTVDIGAETKEDAEKLVNLGDSVYFKSDFVEFGNGFVKAKAIDDRAGCAIMLKMIEEGVEYDTYFTFVVQEEVGLRGSKVASYSVSPDIAVVLESTTAADIPTASDEKRVCELGRGPVVSFMDRSTIYDKELYTLMFETAKEIDVPCQTKTMIAGGNDAGAIHVSRGGVRTSAVSLPCRYLHSPSCVIKKEDFENAYKLVRAFLNKAWNL